MHKLSDDAMMCLICKLEMKSFKEYSVKRHFERKHSEFNDLTDDQKKTLYDKKLNEHFDLRNAIMNQLSSSELVTLAGMKICWLLIK